MSLERVNPAELSPATGFSHAVVATGSPPGLPRRADRARRGRQGGGRHPARAVPHRADQPARGAGSGGGTPGDLARVTVYATDVAEYRPQRARTGRDLAGVGGPRLSGDGGDRRGPAVGQEALVELDGFAVLE